MSRVDRSDLIEHLRASARGDSSFEVADDVDCAGLPDVTLADGASLHIGPGAILRRDVELRATGGARIELAAGVKLDRGVRIIATNGSLVSIGEGSAIGIGSVLNGGDSISVGALCLISGYVYLQTSMHRHERGTPIRHQGFDHAPVVLGDDVWLGAHVAVHPGCHVADGTVVGSNAVLRSSTEPNEIWAGVPARRVGER